MSPRSRRDPTLVAVPVLIGGIIVLSILLLGAQFRNFQRAYFREVAEETKRNNFFLVRAFRDLLASDQLDKMRRMLNYNRGPDPMLVKISARGRGVVVATEGVPAYLVEHVRDPEIRGLLKQSRDEEVLIKFDRGLNSYMIYHAVSFRIGDQDYLLTMASKCNSMTLLLRRTRWGILLLSGLGIGSLLALALGFWCWFRAPLNRLLASMTRITDGELTCPVYVPRSGLVREIALCLQSLTEQLKKQIESLRDGAAEREAILDALSEAVLLIDADGRLEQWNRAADRLFFSERPAAAGDDAPPELRDFLRRLGEAGAGSGELVLSRNGRDFQLLVNSTTFFRSDRRWRLISATDLSDLRKLEADRREFIAAISHEMKTPLTGIVGAVEAINGGALEHETYKARCIETLTRQSERLHTLLQNFLTLTSLEHAEREAERSFLPVQPRAIVRSVLEVNRPAAAAAGIELETGRCDGPEFPGDALLLQQALNNLVSNAILHSGTTRIRIAATVAGEMIDFEVLDYGCGIAAEHQERIFKRFYRVPSGRRRTNGSGIGLAIVKSIALYHHGSVRVDSSPGVGTAFHLLVPLESEILSG